MQVTVLGTAPPSAGLSSSSELNEIEDESRYLLIYLCPWRGGGQSNTIRLYFLDSLSIILNITVRIVLKNSCRHRISLEHVFCSDHNYSYIPAGILALINSFEQSFGS